MKKNLSFIAVADKYFMFVDEMMSHRCGEVQIYTKHNMSTCFEARGLMPFTEYSWVSPNSVISFEI